MLDKRRIQLSTLLAATMLLAGSTAEAHQPGLGVDGTTGSPGRGHWDRPAFGGGGPGIGQLGGRRAHSLRMALRQLDLSESQIEEIRAIFESERETARDNQERMRALSDELREQIEMDPYDEEAVRVKASAVAEIGVEMAVLRARQAGKVREVLTPEQVEELESLKSRREEFRRERRERFEERRRRRSGS